MSLQDRVEAFLMAWVDRTVARRPQPRPPHDRLAGCRVVAHRGVHGHGRLENTLAAFDSALAHGVWGIELDLRWTRDGVPVVVHDPALGRVFGRDVIVAQTRSADLKCAAPEVPTLAEVLERYGGRLHLMVEIKDEPCPDPDRRNRTLAALFAGLVPEHDYHVLSLSLRALEQVHFAPAGACIPVARLNVPRFSRAALGRGWGGIAGHYVLVGPRVLARHHRSGRKVGTGYIGSLNALYREVNRGVDWIFSNQAAQIQGLIRDRADRRPGPEAAP